MECVKLFTSISKPIGIVKLLADQLMSTRKDGSDRDGAEIVDVLNRAFASHPYYKVCDPQSVRQVCKKKASQWKTVPKLDYRDCFEVCADEKKSHWQVRFRMQPRLFCASSSYCAVTSGVVFHGIM